MPNTPSSSNRRTRPSTISSLAPSAEQAARGGPRPRSRTSARISLVARAGDLAHAGLEQLAQIADTGSRRRPSGGCRTDALRTLRAAIANSSMRTASGSVGSSIRCHNWSRSSRRSATRNATTTWPQRRAFFLGQVERNARAEPVDEAVGDLGGEDLVAQAVRADGVGMGLAHRLGEGVEQLRLEQSDRRPAAAPRPRPGARSSTSTGRPPVRAGSARALRCAAAQQFLAGCQALRPCGRAGRWLRAFRSSGRSRAAPPRRRASAIDSARLCSRLSSSTSSATLRRSSSPAGRCAWPRSAGPRAFRG